MDVIDSAVQRTVRETLPVRYPCKCMLQQASANLCAPAPGTAWYDSTLKLHNSKFSNLIRQHAYCTGDRCGAQPALLSVQ